MIHQRKIIKAIAYAILLCFTSLTGAQPLYAIPANTQLPTGEIPKFGIPDGGIIRDDVNNVMTINQGDNKTSVIEWGNFSIGADAAVEFKSTVDGFNSLNYVMNGPVSEIYGQLTALGGNIFIANPAGVQIGNSAQINVGSLYVTNKDIGKALENNPSLITKDSITSDITNALNNVAATNAELMSLGSIISTNNNVTFDGNRIVIDTERLYTDSEGTKMRGLDENGIVADANTIGGLTIKTENPNNVILGYDGKKNDDGTMADHGDVVFTLNEASTPFSTDSGATYHGYQWVRDLTDLQNIAAKENLSGWFALRNSVDAHYTAEDSYKDNLGVLGSGFNPIGNTGSAGNPFTGRFDGLGYDIFGLDIRRADINNIGLFGAIANPDGGRSYVRNFTINSGSIKGNSAVGAAVGNAQDGTVVENIINTADVEGQYNVGGLVGTLSGAVGSDTYNNELRDLINVGTVRGQIGVGGIAGSISNASIVGDTYNLGNVIGETKLTGYDSGVGGIVGIAQNSTIGNAEADDFQIYNAASVTGKFNVGGIVGLLETTGTSGTFGKSKVQNVANHGTITAAGNTDDTYSYHTAENNNNKEGLGATIIDDSKKLASVTVNAANAGGIVGRSRNKGTETNPDPNEQNITVSNVLNDGDVRTATKEEEAPNQATDEKYDYYIAGNVGGIIGSANDTAIDNATNRENSVAGAHNVGGIAGLLTGKSHVKDSTNDGGDVTGTGARYTDKSGNTSEVYERVRPKAGQSDETFIVGNIGGIVGYMYDSDSTKSLKNGNTYTSAGAFIENSTNRGTVHSAEIPDGLIGQVDDNLAPSMKAANVGGVVGKVDMAHKQDMELDVKPSKTGTASSEDDYQSVSIRHSYNTGDVQGYTGIGGIAGMMYNGSVARSFNTGTLKSTRQSVGDSIQPLNMGGVVGDTTELVDVNGAIIVDAGTMIYDVYNAGQIGDETYTYYGRHVGGVVGRLAGEIDKAYNTGDIYNGFSTVGGIAGYWHYGNISNVFNTGNITVVNNDVNNYTSEVGGIVGSYYSGGNSKSTLEYAYNLGTLRSFAPYDTWKTYNRINSVSGILGSLNSSGKLSINNVYTLGNIYAAQETAQPTDENKNNYVSTGTSEIHKIFFGGRGDDGNLSNQLSQQINNFYINPEEGAPFEPITGGNAKAIDYDDRSDPNQYVDANAEVSMSEQIYDVVVTEINENGDTKITADHSKVENGKTTGIPEPGDDNFDSKTYWRIYNGTPILNVFMPYAEDYFASLEDTSVLEGVDSIQYGTAYNPLMTIVNFKSDAQDKHLELNWDELKTTGTAGLAVYGGSLTLNNFQNNGEHYFGGTIYADGDLTINAKPLSEEDKAQFVISDGAKFYGSSVTVSTGGRDGLISGLLQATGNFIDGLLNKDGRGDVTVTTSYNTTGADGETVTHDSGADIEILGQLVSAGGNYAAKTDDDGKVIVKAHEGTVTVFGVAAEQTGDSAADLTSVEINDPGFHDIPTADEVYATVVTNGDENNEAIDGSVSVETDGGVSIRYGNMGIGAVTSYGDFNVEGGDIYLDSYLTLYDDMNLTSVSGGEIALDFTDLYYVEGTEAETAASLGYIHDVFLSHFRDDESASGGHKGDGAYINISGTKNFSIMVDMWDNVNDRFDLDKYDLGKDSFAEHIDVLNISGLGDGVTNKDLTYIWVSDAEQLRGIQEYVKTSPESQNGSDILGFNFALKNNIDMSELEKGETFTSIGGADGYSGTFDGRGFRILGLNVDNRDENGNVTTENAGLFTKLTGTVRDLRIYASNFFGKSSAGAVAGVNEGGTISGVTTLGNHVEATGGDQKIDGTEVYGAAGGIVGINTGTEQNKGTITASNASDMVVANGSTEDKLVTAGGVAGVNTESGLIGAEYKDGAFVTEEGKTAGDYLVTADSAVAATKASESETANVYSLGGAVGVNQGEANLLNSTGVVNGKQGDGYIVDNNVGGIVGVNDKTMVSLYNESIVMGKNNVGGVAGTNSGTMTNVVNATSVTADTTVDANNKDAGNAGGIAGVNSGTITSGRNAGTVTGGQNVGGLVGANNSIDGGKTTGILENLSNALAAVIDGVKHVGGIAGTNSGNIAGSDNLLNEGAIRGNTYVGGVAGLNTGTIQNTNTASKIEATGKNAMYFGGVTGDNQGTISDVMNTSDLTVTDGSYVGGITGRNSGNKAKFEGDLINEGNVIGATNVGGIVGKNENTSGVLQGEEERLYVANRGNVSASSGGAAGIFYDNSDDIENATIENTGVINGYAVDGNGGENTGALFGVNTGSITNSTLKNSGEVTGGKNTGGLIGTNTGNITYSSLINEVGAKVTGTENVGGLIGYNIGMIEGGRKNAAGEDLGLYTYEIYNNGTVSGSANVGGLIGNNAVEGDKTGSLTAGYNTGVVSVTENSEGKNVGGIVGTNAGIIDQVFNTVMTASGTGEKVSGNNNVGGIVGKNEAGAALSNAYNTTSVESDGTKGNIVGENIGTVKNVYATNDKGGMLIGTGNNVLNGYNYDETQKDSASYKELFEDGKDIWKIYEGYSTPLLKVFLTKAEYDGTRETLTYEAKNQSASVDFVTAFDDKAAYKNANSLLTAISGYNAGTYNAFYSGQIAVSGTGGDFNPNNLGYDIDSTFTINKAKLNVTLDDIYREYGNGTMYSDKDHSSVFGSYADAIHIDFAEGTTINETMMAELKGVTVSKKTDGAVDGRSEGQTTNNVSNTPYEWTAKATLGENLAKNYEFVEADEDGTVTATAKSYVTKANLTITLSDVQREYGDAGTLTDGTQYGVVDSEGLTNGDEKSVLRLIADAFTKKLLKDGGLTKDGRTQNVNDENGEQAQYTWRPTDLSAFEGVDNLAQNYNVTYDGGFSTITPRKLTVTDLLAVTDYGNGMFTLEGTPALSGIAYVEDNIELVTDDVVLSFIEGSAYDLNRNNRLTANVIRDDADGFGVYDGSLSVTGLTLKNNDFGNYVLEDKSTGGIKVKPVDLNITLSDVFRIYGDTKLEKGTNYGLADGSDGLGANGDIVGFDGEGVKFVDGGLTQDRRKTENANVSGQTGGYLGDRRYSWNVAESDYEKVFGINPDNYNLTVNAGESKVAQRELTVSGLLASIVYGDKDGNGLKLKEGATLFGFADGYGDDSKVELVIGELTATGDYEDNRTKDNQNRATADVKTDGDGVYRDSLKAGVTLGGDSANNYYIANGTATGGIKVTPAPLTITLNNVTRTYGDAETFVGGIGYGIDGVDGLVNGDEDSENELKLIDNAFEKELIADDGLLLNGCTNDANDNNDEKPNYTWTVKDDNINAFEGIDNLSQNYTLTVKKGESFVEKLTLKLSDLVTSIIYGDQGGQGFSDVDVTLDEGEVVYNDEVYLAGGLKITDGQFDPDGEYESAKNGRATANVGIYNQKVSFGAISLAGKDAGNYDVDGVMNADITVTPAQLTIKADDQNMLIGTTPSFTGTTLAEFAGQLVNGDSLPDGFGYLLRVGDEAIFSEVGAHADAIGLFYNGTFYGDGLTGWGGVFANYDVNFVPGTLTVVPPSTDNYGHLHRDGWDRVRNFRERKAEIFFHEGGMEYAEDM